MALPGETEAHRPCLAPPPSRFTNKVNTEGQPTLELEAAVRRAVRAFWPREVGRRDGRGVDQARGVPPGGLASRSPEHFFGVGGTLGGLFVLEKQKDRLLF